MASFRFLLVRFFLDRLVLIRFSEAAVISVVVLSAQCVLLTGAYPSAQAFSSPLQTCEFSSLPTFPSLRGAL